MHRFNIRTIYTKEIRETLRDRRTIFASLVLPLLLYPLMMLGMVQATAIMARSIRAKVVRIGVVSAPAYPSLASRIEAIPNVELVTISEIPERLAAAEVDLDAAVAFAPGSSSDSPSKIEIVYNSTDELSREARDRIDSALDDARSEIVEARLRARAIDPAVLEPFEVAPVDRASSSQRGGFLLGRLVALLLVIMSLIGAFYPALDLAAGEKERGTIETLLVSPASRGEIVTGKYLAVLTISILTAVVNLGSMGLTFSRLASQMSPGGTGDLSFQITVGQVAVILLALVPFAALTSALAFAISTLARSFKEGQNYLTPLVVLVLVPANLAILPGLHLTTATALVPILNVTLLVKEALIGSVPTVPAIVAIAETLLLTVVALAFAKSLFENEQVLLRDSGDLDWKFWRRPPGVVPRLKPVHGLLTFALVLVLLYYIGSAAQEWRLRAGLVITEVLLVLVPSIAAVAIAGLRLEVGLGFARPRALALVGSVLIGVGSALFGIPANSWLNRVLPPPQEFIDALEAAAKQLAPTSLFDFVVVLTILALLPALCEEALHRGLLMRSLLARFGPPLAIVISGLLFGVFHLSPYRFIWTGALGILLGWVAYRSGSTIASIAAHACNNGAIVLLTAVPVLSAAIGGLDETGEGGVADWVGPLGLATIAAGLVLLRMSPRPPAVATPGDDTDLDPRSGR